MNEIRIIGLDLAKTVLQLKRAATCRDSPMNLIGLAQQKRPCIQGEAPLVKRG